MTNQTNITISSINIHGLKRGNIAPSTSYPGNNASETANGFRYSTASIRRGFIRKVYSLLLLQLMLVFGVTVAFSYMNSKAKEMAIRNWWILMVAIFLYIVVGFTLYCCDSLRRQFPQNLICLVLFTASTSVMVGYIAILLNTEIVMLAIGANAVVVISLTLFAIQTKWDFTVLGGTLAAACGLFVIFGIVMIFIRHYYLEMIYCALGALLFSIYLIYDTQLIIGGNHEFQLSPEEFILGTLSLFLDILNIFLIILRILAANKS